MAASGTAFGIEPIPASKLRWVIGIALLVGLIGFVALRMVVANYDTLASGSGMYYSSLSDLARRHDGKLSSLEGEHFFVNFPITNRGPIGVTIEGIGTLHDDPLFRPLEVWIAPPQLTGSMPVERERFLPFEPFALAPDESRAIAIEFVLGECNLNRHTYALLDSVDVDYSTLGIGQNRRVGLRMAVLRIKGSRDGCRV